MHPNAKGSPSNPRRSLTGVLVFLCIASALFFTRSVLLSDPLSGDAWLSELPSPDTNVVITATTANECRRRIGELRRRLGQATSTVDMQVNNAAVFRDRWADMVRASPAEAAGEPGSVSDITKSMGDAEINPEALAVLRRQRRGSSVVGRAMEALDVLDHKMLPHLDSLRGYVQGWRSKIPKLVVAEAQRQLRIASRQVDENRGLARASQRGTLLNRDELSAGDVPGEPLELPPHPLDDGGAPESAAGRRESVVDAIRASWEAYWTRARDFDELKPVSRRGTNWHKAGALYLTAVDSLTTLHLAGLHAERDAALAHVVANIDRSSVLDADVSQFEATIRLVGSLTSLHELTNSSDALAAARRYGERLMPAYGTRYGIPDTTVNLKHGNSSNPEFREGCTALAEVGSVQLEMRSLAHATGNTSFDRAATRAFKHLRRQLPSNRLAPVYVNTSDGTWCGSDVSVGSLGDSYYEYLLKQYLLSNRTEPGFFSLFRDSADSILKTLLRHTNATVAAEAGLPVRSFLAQATMDASGEAASTALRMEHLACFFPGTLALASRELVDMQGSVRSNHLSFATADDAATHARWIGAAVNLTETCVDMYLRQPTGVSPEVASFPESEPDFVNGDAYYVLRPETMESLFYMWRVTRDRRYRDRGWDIFRRWNHTCRVNMPPGMVPVPAVDGKEPESGVLSPPIDNSTSLASRNETAVRNVSGKQHGGEKRRRAASRAAYAFSGVRHVNVPRRRHDDTMQSFWIAESLKYAMLLFSGDDVLDLDEWVLNTEAHPLRITSAKESETFGFSAQ